MFLRKCGLINQRSSSRPLESPAAEGSTLGDPAVGVCGSEGSSFLFLILSTFQIPAKGSFCPRFHFEISNGKQRVAMQSLNYKGLARGHEIMGASKLP